MRPWRLILRRGVDQPFPQLAVIHAIGQAESLKKSKLFDWILLTMDNMSLLTDQPALLESFKPRKKADQACIPCKNTKLRVSLVASSKVNLCWPAFFECEEVESSVCKRCREKRLECRWSKSLMGLQGSMQTPNESMAAPLHSNNGMSSAQPLDQDQAVCTNPFSRVPSPSSPWYVLIYVLQKTLCWTCLRSEFCVPGVEMCNDCYESIILDLEQYNAQQRQQNGASW